MPSAIVSLDGAYRYWLERERLDGTGTCGFVMLNPSTADAVTDDATIRRCMGFVERWGYRRLVVANLFAYRAREPSALSEVDDPVGGPDTATYLLRLAEQSSRVVAAWGAHAPAERAREVTDLLLGWAPAYGLELCCLGVTSKGAPKHPLRLAADTLPVPWPVLESEKGRS